MMRPNNRGGKDHVLVSSKGICYRRNSRKLMKELRKNGIRILMIYPLLAGNLLAWIGARTGIRLILGSGVMVLGIALFSPLFLIRKHGGNGKETAERNR